MKTKRFSGIGVSFAILCLSVANLAAQPPADLVSGFDSSAESWLTSDPGVTLTWETNGGSSGGYLKGEGPGGDWYYVTPASWSGDWSGYEAIKFDLAIPSRHYADSDTDGILLIVGTNLETMTWTGPTPLFTWSHYEISLEPYAFGVDQATFDGIMADVAEMRILAEYTTSSEDVGLDSVVVTSTPIQLYEDALIERFTSAEKVGTRVNGWKPVDDVTLLPRPEEGFPLHSLYCDDWQDGRIFKVESPDSWAGDWSNFTELSFDIKWDSTGGGVPGPSLVRVFGANGDVLIYDTLLPEDVWSHVTVPLVPSSFGPAVDQTRLDAVLAHVSKIWISGEYDDGNDQLWLDNIVVSDGPLAATVFETSLISRFGSGAEGWTVFDNAILGWDETLGFTGGAITCSDQGSGSARFCSPDSWSGDWRSFKSLRFMMRTVSSGSRADYSPNVAIYGYNGEVLVASPPPPYQTWSPYTLDLDPLAFGVSQAEFDAVMRDVAHLTIVGDIVLYNDTSALDDVSLVSNAEPQAPPPDLGSTFDTDAEGWRKGGPTGDNWGFLSSATVHSTIEGNPPGCITVGDEFGTTYWFSPVSWAGDWTGLEWISFDMKIINGSAGRVLGPGNILAIISVHGNLFQAIETSPEVALWNEYQFDLTPLDFGVSRETFDRIMRDVVMVGIRSEWIRYGELEGLDNVLLTEAPDDSYWVWLGGYLAPMEIGDPALAAKSADYDHDGWSNWGEFMALTDPSDPLSCMRPQVSESGPTVSYRTKTGRSYQVWRSTDITDPAMWTKAGPVETGDDTLIVYTDTEYTSGAYYRVEVFRP